MGRLRCRLFSVFWELEAQAKFLAGPLSHLADGRLLPESPRAPICVPGTLAGTGEGSLVKAQGL